MPNTKSSRKRVRQNEKRRIANKAVKSRIKTETKKFGEYIDKNEKEKATEQLSIVCKLLDKATKRNIVTKNTAARRKSLCARKLNVIIQT